MDERLDMYVGARPLDVEVGIDFGPYFEQLWVLEELECMSTGVHLMSRYKTPDVLK